MTRGHREHDRAAMQALRRIVRALRLAERANERTLGISVAQLFVLRHLVDGPRSNRELAEHTLTDPSSVSVVVTRLCERGLVERGPDERDARRIAIALTDEGRALLRRSPEVPQTRLFAALAALPAPRSRALAETLTEIAEALGAVDPTFFFEEE
jgi:DNA-binding MarR family transcriptional regulator